jgi:hypothetical protein
MKEGEDAEDAEDGMGWDGMGWEMQKSVSWNRGGLGVDWYCGFMAGSGSQNQ